jgi:5'-3' exonuclease
MKPTILLIDLSSLFWCSWHATENDVASDAIKLTMAGVRRCQNQNPGALTAICLDKGRSFRKDMAPTYKAQRPEKDHSALNQLRDCKQQLIDAGYLLWGVDGFEADDVIATVATKAVAEKYEVCIASADKDLLQLLAMPGVFALRTFNDWVVMHPGDVITKIGVDPAGLGDYLALVGDKSDNIEGAKGVGPVTAKKLLLDHYNLDGIYGRIDQLVTMGGGKLVTKTPEAAKVATPAVIQSLFDNKDKVLLARKLVTLRTDAPIKFEEIFEKREPKAAKEIPDMDKQSKFEDARIGGAPKDEPSPQDSKPVAVEAAHGGGAAITPESALPKAYADTWVASSVLPNTAAMSPAETVTTTLVPVAYERALEPTSLGQCFKLAAELYKSGLYAKFNTPQAMAAVIMRGREMGIGALTSMDAWHCIEGKPCPSAQLIVALAKQHVDCEFFQLTASDETSATWTTKNRKNPTPTIMSYTLAEAETAGLAGKPGPWTKYKKTQLIKMAAVRLARVEYPDAILGLVAIEEME